MAASRSPFADTDFVWGPPRSALCWVDVDNLGTTRGGFEGLDMPGRYLTTEEPDPLGAQPHYSPMRPPWGIIGENPRKGGVPVLFRRFIALEPTENAILSFARRCGMLTSGTLIQRSVSRDEAVGHLAEPLALWRTEILAMRRMVEVWDAVQDSKLDVLVQLVKIRPWQEGARVWYQGTRRLYAILNPARRAVAESSVRRRALFLIQKIVNDRLKAHTAPILSYVSAPTQSPAVGGNQLRLQVAPINLIGALWLQFARGIEGNREYRRCDACGEWLEIAPGSYTKRVRFCRPVCRVNFHRRKR